MRIFLILIIASALFGCSHDPIITQPPPSSDTLGPGWRRISIATTEPIGDIFFTDNTTGFCITGSFIFRSTDGGEHWQKIYQAENGTGKFLLNIAMGSPNNAIFVLTGANKTFFTHDGGNTIDSVTNSPNDHPFDAFFVSPTVAYAVGQYLWKTRNAGSSWTTVSTSNADTVFGYKSLFFLNEQTGWVTGGGLLKTTNGGTSWQRESIPGVNGYSMGAIYFADQSNGYVSDGNSVSKTANGGSNYSEVFRSEGFHDIHFVSAQTGYITDGKYIRKTTDGGQTWTKDVVVKDNSSVIEIHFTDALHGWACGGNGTILKYEQ